MPDPSVRQPAHLRQRRRGRWAIVAGALLAVAVLAVAVVALRRGDRGPVALDGPVGPSRSVDEASEPTVTAPPLPAVPPGEVVSLPARAVAAGDRAVVALTVEGARAATLFELPEVAGEEPAPPAIGGVALSSDGRTAFFDVVGGQGGTGEMRSVPLDGGPVADLGRGEGPSPSPDGATLAHLAEGDPDAPATVVLRPLAGPGAERRLELGAAACGTLSWSPDGRTLAADLCEEGTPTTVVLVQVDGGGPPRRLAPPGGATWTLPAHRPDGRLAVAEQRGTTSAARLVDAAGGPGEVLFERAETTLTSLDFGPGGQLLLCDADAQLAGAVPGQQVGRLAEGYLTAAW